MEKLVAILANLKFSEDHEDNEECSDPEVDFSETDSDETWDAIIFKNMLIDYVTNFISDEYV